MHRAARQADSSMHAFLVTPPDEKRRPTTKPKHPPHVQTNPNKPKQTFFSRSTSYDLSFYIYITKHGMKFVTYLYAFFIVQHVPVFFLCMGHIYSIIDRNMSHHTQAQRPPHLTKTPIHCIQAQSAIGRHSAQKSRAQPTIIIIVVIGKPYCTLHTPTYTITYILQPRHQYLRTPAKNSRPLVRTLYIHKTIHHA